MAFSGESTKIFQAVDATILLDDHASVSQRSILDLQFGSPKLLVSPCNFICLYQEEFGSIISAGSCRLLLAHSFTNPN